MRIKSGPQTRRRHGKILKLAKGYRMTRSKLYRVAHEAYMHAGQYSFYHRHHRGAQMRKLWIIRLNNALRERGEKYSEFMKKFAQNEMIINRKMLSELAISYPTVFDKIVKQVKG